MKKMKTAEEIALLEYLGEIYRRNTNQRRRLDLEINEKESAYQAHDVCKLIDETLRLISYSEAEIIKNDFLWKENKNWWFYKYDKSTYECAKNMAIRAFFRCLYT
ncbi:MAG: hypothetical protein RSC10_00650 [Longicatena sp.]